MVVIRLAPIQGVCGICRTWSPRSQVDVCQEMKSALSSTKRTRRKSGLRALSACSNFRSTKGDVCGTYEKRRDGYTQGRLANPRLEIVIDPS